MKPHVLGALCLRARLRLATFGSITLTGCVLCLLGACLWLAVVPQARGTLARAQHKLVNAQAALASAPAIDVAPAPPLARINLEKFTGSLGEARYPEQQIKTLLALAGKTGVKLGRAEYKYAHDPQIAMETVGIVLPVSGTYAAIREFCVAMLLAIPFASLDDIGFKRTAIGSERIDASLRFTLYLVPSAPAFGEAGKP